MATKKKLKYGAVPAKMQAAINAIEKSFRWIDTPQGLDYWENVVQNIERMLDEVAPLRKKRS